MAALGCSTIVRWPLARGTLGPVLCPHQHSHCAMHFPCWHGSVQEALNCLGPVPSPEWELYPCITSRDGECFKLHTPSNTSTSFYSDFCYSSDSLHSAAQIFDFSIKKLCCSGTNGRVREPLPFHNTHRDNRWGKRTSWFQHWATRVSLQLRYQEEDDLLECLVKPFLGERNKKFKIIYFIQKLCNFNALLIMGDVRE